MNRTIRTGHAGRPARRAGALFGFALLALTTGCEGYTAADLIDIENFFVKLEAEPAEVADLAASLSSEIGFEPLHIYDRTTQGFSLILPRKAAADMEEWTEVEYVLEAPIDGYVPPDEDNEEIIDDPIQINPDEIPESIARIGGAWTAGGLSAVHVAVIDTGIEASHRDLNVVAEFDAVAEGGGTPAPGQDPNGHGTHVAGTIGAIANDEGVVGVAPGVPLHAVRVLDGNGSGSWTDIMAGLEYVLDHPEIRVANLSLGGAGSPDQANDPLREALQALEDAGVILCIAAGNDTENTSGFVPAGYDLGVVVSAYDASGGSDNGFASFSNFGDAVDIAAPGVDIMSTWPGGGYAAISGTSMATPAVAGAAAAFVVGNPNATAREFRQALLDSGEDGYSGQTGPNGRHPELLIDTSALWD